MSQLQRRTPGVVGAALAHGGLWCGIIADGHHVHPAALAIALGAKQGPGRLFLVTDAMPPAGDSGDVFILNGPARHPPGRRADAGRRHAGRLRPGDGRGPALRGRPSRPRAGRGAAHARASTPAEVSRPRPRPGTDRGRPPRRPRPSRRRAGGEADLDRGERSIPPAGPSRG